MELSDTKIRELIHALARDTRTDNIIAAEGYTREFIEDFARRYADEICEERRRIKEDFRPEREEGRTYGIDVSSWQGVIEWNRVKQSSHDGFAMLRAAYGTEPDSRFEDNYEEATRANVPVGAYLYTLALNEEEAREEADRLIEILRGKRLPYPIALDIEERAQAELDKERVSAIIDAFCSQMEQARYYVMVYSYEDFLRTHLTDEIRNKYDIWVADIGETPDIDFGIHQYSFRGDVDGIRGDVDLDYAVKDYPEIMRENNLNGF